MFKNFLVFNCATEGFEQIDLLPDQPIPDADGHCLSIDIACAPNAHHPFRTLDGTCNNLRNGRRGWGATERPFRRRLQPVYADGKKTGYMHVTPWHM